VARLALVTGASSGIGRATAQRLVAAGWTVLAGVRNSADAPPQTTPVELDVTDSAAVAAAARQVDGELHGLVNNAGISVAGPLELVPMEDFRRQIEVNLLGQVALTQALLPALRATRGRIVLVSSVGGRVAQPFLSPYAASKFGLEAVADSLRVELHRTGVRTALIEPGAVDTPIWDKGLAGADELESRVPPELRDIYAPGIEAMKKFAADAPKRAVPPDKVAEAIEHALTASRPRTRYVVGREARMMIALHRLLPDRAFDAVVRRVGGF
jgi:NAD(P)-dependent dehydrogenase (short-subunit alcohol dehydrogenase family)